MQNIFEKASKQKLRFATTKGMLSTEELWDLSLESLDNIAKSVNKSIKAEEEESFIGKRTTANTEATLKLEVLKRIIEVKLEEKDKRAARAERNAKLSQLKDLAATKANEKLADTSLDEIQKMIAELEAED